MRVRARTAEHRIAVIEHHEHSNAGADAGQYTTDIERDQQPARLGARNDDRDARQQRREKQAPKASAMIDPIARILAEPQTPRGARLMTLWLAQTHHAHQHDRRVVPAGATPSR